MNPSWFPPFQPPLPPGPGPANPLALAAANVQALNAKLQVCCGRNVLKGQEEHFEHSGASDAHSGAK